MKNINFKAFLPHLIAIVLFVLVSILYFFPLLQGKQLKQHDIAQFKGMSKEIVDFRQEHHAEPLWTNSMFGGMPAYQISVLYPANLIKYVDRVVQLGLPRPANYLFLYMIGFYILLLTLKLDYRIAIAGALAFAFSSYFLIILEAGHNSKAHAISYMAPVIAGVLLTFRGRLLTGGLLTAFALALELNANHLQITYYLFLVILLLGFVELFKAFRNKTIPLFLKSLAVLIPGVILAIGCNITNLWSTYEYGKYTTRGKSELTAKQESTGLDKDYALSWSYGVSETMTLLIPDFFGGASQGELSKSSATYKALNSNGVPSDQAMQIIKQAPVYWGDQPFTSGPVYVGAIVIFLFVFGMFVIREPEKWWLVAATLLSFLLSWGKNFQSFTDLFFDYFPGYNKFRAVSMILVIAELTMPLLGFWALKKILDGSKEKEELKKYLKLAFYIVGGICALFMIAPGMFCDFIGPVDEQLKGGGYPEWLISAFREDRASLLRMDAFRSFFLILLTAGLLWAYISDKINKKVLSITLIVLVLFDLGLVSKRYLDKDDFVPKSQAEQPFQPSNADLQIMADKDPDFRVLNTTVSTFNDASTSYFHKSIGGYHGAKLKRYQELIDAQISRNNMAVLNMLNTKYFIVQPQNAPEPIAQQNPGALGHAWFVKEYKLVANADSELNALTNFDPSQTAIVDKRFADLLPKTQPGVDTAASIKLLSYAPNHLVYETTSSKDQLAVFSEIYYDKGWNVYLDGKPAPYFRTNYVLRGMSLPVGNHKVEFKFEPEVYYKGEKIALASSILMFLIAFGAIAYSLKNKRE